MVRTAAAGLAAPCLAAPAEASSYHRTILDVEATQGGAGYSNDPADSLRVVIE